MKKYKIITAICCALILSACGKNTDKQKTLPDGLTEPCRIRFSWWGGDDRHKATLNAIELWKTLHPEIEIIPEYGGWDGWSEKVNSQISGGTEPDVMQINYDWLISLSPDGNTFYDLGQLTETLDLSGFDSETLSFGKTKGHLNAVTVSLSGRGLFYNSEVYRRLGAEYPETWEELLQLGNKFYSNGIYPLDLDIGSGGTAWYLAVVYTQQKTGREFITLDGSLGFSRQDLKTALDFYKALEDNHVIRKVKVRTDEDGNSALYQSPEFISGNVAGVLEWGSSVGKYEMVLPEGVLEAGPMLKDENGCSDGWLIKPSLLYAISANTKYPDESALFMNFLLNSPECAEILGTTRGIPASCYARESLEKSGNLKGLANENNQMLESLNTVTISPYMEMARMKKFYNTAVESVSYSLDDTQAIADELYDSITEYLEKIRE